MSDLSDLLGLLGLAALVAAWLAFSRARERAIEEVRRQCRQHGLQLLDETVGLRGLRLVRGANGLAWQRTYAFEVSTSGDDRLAGRMTLAGDTMTGLSLPMVHAPTDAVVGEQVAPAPSPTGSSDGNVVPFRPRRRTLH